MTKKKKKLDLIARRITVNLTEREAQHLDGLARKYNYSLTGRFVRDLMLDGLAKKGETL